MILYVRRNRITKKEAAGKEYKGIRRNSIFQFFMIFVSTYLVHITNKYSFKKVQVRQSLPSFKTKETSVKVSYSFTQTNLFVEQVTLFF